MHGELNAGLRASLVATVGLAVTALIFSIVVGVGSAGHAAPAPAAEPALSHGPGGTLDLAHAADGTVAAAWLRRDGSAQQVVSSIRRPGRGWTRPRVVSEAGGDLRQPVVAVNPDGAAVVVWRDEEQDTVLAATRPAGGPWQAPERISGDGTGTTEPAVALSLDGVATAVWRQDEDGSAGIVTARHEPGTGWGQVSVLTSALGDASEPAVAVAPDGETVAAWWVWRGSAQFVVSASRTPGSPWSPEILVSGAHQSVSRPDLVMDAEGRATAVWSVDDGTGESNLVESASRPSGGPWGAPERISTGYGAREPAVAVAPGGTTVAASWTRVGLVEAARRVAGDWKAPETVLVGYTHPWTAPAVTSRSKISIGYQRARDGVGRSVEVVTRGRSAWSDPLRLDPGAETAMPELAPTRGATTVAWERFSPEPGDIRSAELVGRPHISGLSLTRSRVYVPRSPRSPKATTARLTLGAPATVTVTVVARDTGRRLARLVRERAAGPQRVRIPSRIQGRTLEPGTYRLLFRAGNAAGSGRAAEAAVVVGR